MIVLGLVVGSDLAVVCSDRGYVISNNVNHNPDAFGVCSGNESFQIISRAEVAIDGVPVSGPVSVIAIWGVINYWTNPNSIETHTSYIVEVVLESFESSTAVV